MPKDRQSRLQRAWQETRSFHGWGRRLFEAVLVGVPTYFMLFRAFSPGDAVQYVAVAAVALCVGLIVVPVCELAWNYARAPLSLELEALRAENARLAEVAKPKAVSQSVTPPAAPISLPTTAAVRSYVRESPREIVDRIKSLKWNEQEAVAKVSYIGRWIRGSGTIGLIRNSVATPGGLSVMVTRTEIVEYVHLDFDRDHRHVIEVLEEGDHVEYDGEISAVTRNDISLTNATITKLNT
jgi:hypothetical protein